MLQCELNCSSLPSISVPARRSAVLSPRRVSQTTWSSLHVTTLWCTTRCTLWAAGRSSSELTWTTASHRSPWTESALPTDSMMSCLSAQVNDLFSVWTLNLIFNQDSDDIMHENWHGGLHLLFQTKGQYSRWSMFPRRAGTTWKNFCWRSWKSSK